MKPLFIKKNGTVSKVSGIIMNLIPSYTLAEYNALTHKPLFWVRTDEEYAQIPASDVSYGNGSVEDALDNRVSVPTSSATEVTSVNGTYNYTPTKNGWLSLVGSGGSSGNSFTIRIRDSVLYQYGVSVTIQVAAYTTEPLCCMQVKANRTYAISTNSSAKLYFIE